MAHSELLYLHAMLLRWMTVRWIPLAFVWVASTIASDAASSVNEAVRTSATTVPQTVLTPSRRGEISIPYPNAGMYLDRGIYGSFAGGRSATQYTDSVASKLRWQDPLFQWQGEIGYFYTEWFSGGVGFRINAGSPNDDEQIVKNRYFLLMRFHKAWPRAAAYVGTHVGVDDVSFSLAANDSLGVGDRLSESNAGIGLVFGSGWKFSRYAGATFGQRIDVSLVRQNAANSHRALNLATQPGLALDLVRVFPSLALNVKAFYLLSELQFGQSLPERGRWTQQLAAIAGLSMAF